MEKKKKNFATYFLFSRTDRTDIDLVDISLEKKEKKKQEIKMYYALN